MSYQQPYQQPNPQPGPGGQFVPQLGKTRSPWGIWGLALITLGIYSFVWWYKINREMRDFCGLDVKPGMSVLALIPGSYLIVPPFVSAANTANRVRQTQAFAGRQQDCSAGLTILLYILLATHMPYIQRRLNDVWAQAQGYAAPAAA